MKVRKRKKVKRRIIVLSVITLIIISVTLYFNKCVNPVIYSVAETKVQSLSHTAVNKALKEVLNNNSGYSELIEIITGNDGKIRLIQANSMKINALAADTLAEVMKNLKETGNEGIGIPIGTMSGIPLLTGRGPDLTIKLKPVSDSEYKYYSEFKTAGINQTSHKIYFEIINHIKAVVPGLNKEYTTSVTVLIAENIIVGEIPSFYLNAGKIEGSLNLVP